MRTKLHHSFNYGYKINFVNISSVDFQRTDFNYPPCLIFGRHCIESKTSQRNSNRVHDVVLVFIFHRSNFRSASKNHSASLIHFLSFFIILHSSSIFLVIFISFLIRCRAGFYHHSVSRRERKFDVECFSWMNKNYIIGEKETLFFTIW